MEKLYLAYGSNLNVVQMRWRCPDAVLYGTSVIPDYELLYKGSKTGAYLTIEPREGGQVPVAVWMISAADERRLDSYEGFPNFYYKKNIKVKVGTETVDAFAYIMHEERKLAKPSKHYIICCQHGYEAFDFDKKYLDDAYERSVSNER